MGGRIATMIQMRAWLRRVAIVETNQRRPITFYLLFVLSGVFVGLACDWRHPAVLAGIAMGMVVGGSVFFRFAAAFREIIDEQSNELEPQKRRIPPAEAPPVGPVRLVVNWLIVIVGLVLAAVMLWRRLS